LVADEPTGDLDRQSAAQIMDLLQRLNRELGRTLIMVTHDSRTSSYATRTLHLEKGRLLESGQSGADAEDAYGREVEYAIR
jgi:putative ABC transport system ATP-binding protein